MPRIYFQHFTHQPQNASQFYETIGRVVVLWGRLEAVIDATILVILEHPEVTFKRPESMPVSFKGKLGRWEEIFKQEPVVQELKKKALAFSNKARPVAQRRNDVIHAAIGEFSPEGVGVTAESIKHKGPRSTLRVFKLVQSDLEALAEDIVKLHNSINPIALICHVRTASAKRKVLPDPI